MIMKDLKYGFTTGSCAAAAAKAATLMLFEQRSTDTVSVMTPAGVRYDAPVEEVMLTKTEASCAVRKPGSDDPDVTAGILIYAKASLAADNSKSAGKYKDRVIIEGGEGIGRVTKPGLDRPVGDAAINTVPRRMIEAEVRSVAEEYGYSSTISIVISVPEGAAIGRSIPIAAASGCSISITSRQFVPRPTSLTARRSTLVIPQGIVIRMRGLKIIMEPHTFWTANFTRFSVISYSAMTPLRSG
ncbi:MAG: cobalt-precorrin-5B (C(1))-methyltransferase [Lachnospiraceae bacterium]|nr:cobalt-precorrin-5B (C(1))-methyltransferase [Lachnospiraceae bacterium]